MDDMREKLIKLIQDAVNGCARNWAEIIADHLIQNGVILPPCKVGDTVYELTIYKDKLKNQINGYINHRTVSSIHMSNNQKDKDKPYLTLSCDFGYCKRVPLEAFGKTVFLTKEEAEKALEERKE